MARSSIQLVLFGIAALACMVTRAAWGGDVALVVDLNTESSGYGSYPNGFFELSPGRVLFTATEFEHGRELWVTDGTEAGTRLLADLVPGPTSSLQESSSFVALGGRALFFSHVQGYTQDLWSTDGTTAGTVRLARWTGGTPRVFGQIGGRLLFTTLDAGEGGLYASDGTVAQPVLLAAGLSPDFSVPPIQRDGSLLFAGSTRAEGKELWRTDGTAAGTRLVADLAPGSASSNPSQLVEYRSMVYFVATTPTTGSELFRTDGTADGTEVVIELLTGPTGTSPAWLTRSGDYLYFAGPDLGPAHYGVIYIWSPETGAVNLISRPFTSPTNILGIVPLGAGIAFIGPESQQPVHESIWTLDPLSQAPVMRLRGTLFGLEPPAFIAPLGDGYFISRDHRVEYTDVFSGTAVTIFPSIRDVIYLRRVGNRALFARLAGTGRGLTLYFSDGTVQNTVPFVTVSGPVSPNDFAVLSDGRIVYEWEGAGGNEPWISDGTPDGTRRLRNIDLRTFSSGPRQGFTLNNRFFFYRGGPNSSSTIWFSRGTPQSTGPSFDPGLIVPGQTMAAHTNLIVGNHLFVPIIGGLGRLGRLYKTDGTQANTSLVYEASGSFSNLLLVGNEIWFMRDDTFGTGIGHYRTDGTPAGTRLITNKIGYTRREAAVGNGAAYLTDDVLPGDTSATHRIWFSDGTDAGTRVVWTAPSTGGFDFWHIGAGSAAYFCVDTSDNGSTQVSIIRVDSTGVATQVASYSSSPSLVGDLGGGDIAVYPATSGSLSLGRTIAGATGLQALARIKPYTQCAPQCVVSARLNGSLFFAAAESSGSNYELWRTDGTSEGTYRVADVRPGEYGSTPHNLFSDGRMLYFTALTLSNATELWQSDGTGPGTTLVSTFWLAPTNSREPIVLGSTDDGVFFSADNRMLGFELHLLRPGLPDCNRNLILDEVDIDAGLSIDANGDGRPDECCRTDFNSDGQSSLHDLFDFLSAWFSGQASADFNRTDGITVQDLLDFLGEWFRGCA